MLWLTAFTGRSGLCSMFQTVQGCFCCHVHNKRVHMAQSDVHSSTKSSDALMFLNQYGRFGHSSGGFLRLCQELGRITWRKLNLMSHLPCGAFWWLFFVFFFFLKSADLLTGCKIAAPNKNECRFFFFFPFMWLKL